MKKRCLSLLICLAMLISLMPMVWAASETHNPEEKSGNGLTLSKSVEESNGSYSLTLTAKETSTVTENLDPKTPTDVIFVVDQSSSMASMDIEAGFKPVQNNWKASDISGSNKTYYYDASYNYPIQAESGTTYSKYKDSGFTIDDTIVSRSMTKNTWFADAGYQNDDGWAYSNTNYYAYDSDLHEMRAIYVRSKGYTANAGHHNGGWWLQFFYLKDLSREKTGLIADESVSNWFLKERDTYNNVVMLPVSGTYTYSDGITGDIHRENPIGDGSWIPLGTGKINKSFQLSVAIYSKDQNSNPAKLYYTNEGEKVYLNDAEDPVFNSLTKDALFDGTLYYYEEENSRMGAVKEQLKQLSGKISDANNENRMAVVGFSGNGQPYYDANAINGKTQFNNAYNNQLLYMNTGVFSDNRFINYHKENTTLAHKYSYNPKEVPNDTNAYYVLGTNGQKPITYDTAYWFYKVSQLEGGNQNNWLPISRNTINSNGGIDHYQTIGADDFGFFVKDVISGEYYCNWTNRSSGEVEGNPYKVTLSDGTLLNDINDGYTYKYQMALAKLTHDNGVSNQQYENALISDENTINAYIDNLKTYGKEHDAGLGLTMANKIFENSGDQDRQRIVVFVTDKTPSNDIKNEAIKQAAALKNDYKATVYAVGIGTGADEGYLNQISSDYYPKTGDVSDNQQKVHDSDYVKVARSTFDIEDLFNDISSLMEEHTREIWLREDAELRDYINLENFDISNVDENDITVTGGGTASLNKRAGLVTVTGHDYGTQGQINVTIPGLKPVKIGDLETNTDQSGIYNNNEMVLDFPMPWVKVEQDPEPGELRTDKTLEEADEGGTYEVSMTAYSTGTYSERPAEPAITEPVPMDIALVIDQSSSMATEDMGADYYPTEKNSWTVDEATGGQTYFYKVGEKYYPVQADYGTVYEKVDQSIRPSSLISWDDEGISFLLNGSPTYFNIPTNYYINDNGTLRKVFLITVAREFHYSLYAYVYTDNASADDIARKKWHSNIAWFGTWNVDKLKRDRTWEQLANGNKISFVNSNGQAVGGSRSAGDGAEFKYSLISSSGKMSNLYQVSDAKAANSLYYVDDNGNKVQVPGSKTVQLVDSVAYNGSLWYAQGTSRLHEMTTAVQTFISDVKTVSPESRMAIIGFAGNEVPALNEGSTAYDTTKYDYTDTGLFVNGDFLNYKKITSYKAYNGTKYINRHYFIKNGKDYIPVLFNTSTGNWYRVDETNATVANGTQFYEPVYEALDSGDYDDALLNVSSDQQELQNITTHFGAYGGTFTSYGMAMANTLLSNIKDKTYTMQTGEKVDRERMIVVFTDGEPGANGYDSSIAGEAIMDGNRAKNEQGATVYTIGLFKGNVTSEIEDFMRNLSSEYTVSYNKVYGGAANYGLGNDLNADKTYYYIDEDEDSADYGKAFAVTATRGGGSSLGWWLRTDDAYMLVTPKSKNGGGSQEFFSADGRTVYAADVQPGTTYYDSSSGSQGGNPIVYEYRWYDSNRKIIDPKTSENGDGIQFYELASPVANMDNQQYYMKVDSAEGLNAAFKSITSSIPAASEEGVDTTVVYDSENSFLMDEFTSDFNLPENRDDIVHVYTYDSKHDNQGKVIYQKDDHGEFILDRDGNKIPEFDEESRQEISYVTKVWQGDTLYVGNYDYAYNYVGDGHPGKLLEVVVTGLTPKHTGNDIPSNTPKSGIYAETTSEGDAAIELVSQFPVPTIDIPGLTVTWMNDDTILQTNDGLLYGNVAQYNGDTPTREPVTSGYTTTTYSFIGWTTDENATTSDTAEFEGPEAPPVTEDVTYYAVFQPTEKHVVPYTVHWVNGNDEITDPQTVMEGTVPNYEGEKPTKDATGNKTYAFVGWTTDPNKVVYSGELEDYLITDPVETYAPEGSTEVTFYAAYSELTSTTKNFIVEYSTKNLLDEGVFSYDVLYDYGGKFSLDDSGNFYFTAQAEKDGKDYDLTGFSQLSSAQYYIGDPESGNATLTTVTIIPGTSVYYDDTLLSETVSEKDTVQENNSFNYSAALENKNNTENDAEKLDKGTVLKFTFSGSRIDIYCTTDPTANSVYTTLKNLDGTDVYDINGNKAKAMLMSNKFTNGGTFYNTPTISYGDLDSSKTYVLTLRAETENYRLDGIRVYNPVKADTKVTADKTVNDVYADYRDNNAVFYNVRKILLNDKSAFDEFTQDGVEGAVFVDNLGPGQNATFDQYKDKGPKNEVYLEKGQGVAFTVSGFQKGMKLMVGLRAQQSSALAKATNGEGNLQTIPVNSVTEAYYTVEPDDNGHVLIWNDSDPNQLLSITNVKVSGTASPAKLTMMVRSSLRSYVMNAPQLPVIEAEQEPVVDPTQEPEPDPTVTTEPEPDPTETTDPTVEPVIDPEPDPADTTEPVIEDPTQTEEPTADPTEKPESSSSSIIQKITKAISNAVKAVSKLVKSLFRW